jgi:hypothetical protein
MRHPSPIVSNIPRMIATLVVISGCCGGQSGDQHNRARVTVIAVDSFGKQFQDFTVVSFEDDHKRELKGRFVGHTAEGIPLDSYWIKIEFRTGGRMNWKVRVDRPDCLLVLGANPLHIEYHNGDVPILAGSVQNVPREFAKPIWIKTCGLFISECEVAKVEGDGHFSFLNVTPAAYTISLLSSSGDALTERLDVQDPDLSITFDVARPAGDRLIVRERTVH